MTNSLKQINWLDNFRVVVVVVENNAADEPNDAIIGDYCIIIAKRKEVNKVRKTLNQSCCR